ncbi:MAG: hypothetical protein ACE5J5_07915 [Candidatus Hydrothermarchaeales archaeon]
MSVCNGVLLKVLPFLRWLEIGGNFFSGTIAEQEEKVRLHELTGRPFTAISFTNGVKGFEFH